MRQRPSEPRAGGGAIRRWTRSGEDTCDDLKAFQRPSWYLDPTVLFYRAAAAPPGWPKKAKEGLSSIICLVDQVERMPLVFPVPPLSTRAANLVAFFFSASYVASLYLSKHARLGNSSKTSGKNASTPQNRTRDDPSVIKARMVAASTSTILSCAVVFLLVWHIVDDLENVGDPNLVTTVTQRNSSP